jgi:hypothetical protein
VRDPRRRTTEAQHRVATHHIENERETRGMTPRVIAQRRAERRRDQHHRMTEVRGTPSVTREHSP